MRLERWGAFSLKENRVLPYFDGGTHVTTQELNNYVCKSSEYVANTSVAIELGAVPEEQLLQLGENIM